MNKTKLMKQIGMVVIALMIIVSVFMAGLILKMFINIFMFGWNLIGG